MLNPINFRMNRLNLASSFFSLFVLFFLNGCGPQKLPSSAGLDQWLMHETIVYENKELSPEIYEEKASITVDLTQQLVTLYLGGEKVMVARTSTGIRTNTPVGSFRVTEKVESGKVSNVYGKIYDSNDEYVYLGQA